MATHSMSIGAIRGSHRVPMIAITLGQMIMPFSDAPTGNRLRSG